MRHLSVHGAKTFGASQHDFVDFIFAKSEILQFSSDGRRERRDERAREVELTIDQLLKLGGRAFIVVIPRSALQKSASHDSVGCPRRRFADVAPLL